MDIQEYIYQNQKIQSYLLDFIEKDNNYDNCFELLIKCINNNKITQNRVEFKLFLLLIYDIANNHHRNQMFFPKLEKILLTFKDQIKQYFSNTEIFELFKRNKVMILFFIQNEIINLDKTIANLIYEQRDRRLTPYYTFYFYPEIKPFLDENDQLTLQSKIETLGPYVLDDFEEKRNNGVNDSYLCKLIREDSVIEFIKYVNKKNLPLSGIITPSIYETNTFFINRNVTLIEYAAFYGSIQIFQYLRMNDVEIRPIIWLYAIHSNNGELIHLIEEEEMIKENNYINPPKLFKEAIKCHHNDIANYIRNCMLQNNYSFENSNIFKYHNYLFFDCCHIDYDDKNIINRLVENNYYKIVTFILESNEAVFNEYISDFIKFELTPDYPRSNLLCNLAKKNNYEMIDLLLQESKPTKLYYFRECQQLTQISIPQSVIEIGDFSDCSSLKEMSIPSSVTTIDDYCFMDCSSLKKISIPSSVTKIDKYCFNCCTSLTEISIQSSVTEIGKYCFSGCSSLKEISIPSSVTKIGEFCFNGCSSLRKLVIQSSIEAFEKSCFEGCSSLEEITIPSSLPTEFEINRKKRF